MVFLISWLFLTVQDLGQETVVPKESFDFQVGLSDAVFDSSWQNQVTVLMGLSASHSPCLLSLIALDCVMGKERRRERRRI